MHGVGGPAWSAPTPPLPLGLRVRVFGLPPKTSPRDLIRLFSTDCGQSLVCTPEKHIQETGSAVLEFSNEMCVQAALRMSGSNWNDHQIRVEVASRPSQAPLPMPAPAVRVQPEIHPDRLIHHQRRSPSPPSRYRPMGGSLSPRNRFRANSQPGGPSRFHKQIRNTLAGSQRRPSFPKSRSLSLSNRSSPERSPASVTPLKAVPRSASAPVPLLPVLPAAQPSAAFSGRWSACFRSGNIDSLRQRLARVSADLEEARRATVKAEVRVLAAESHLIVDRLRLVAVDTQLQSLRCEQPF